MDTAVIQQVENQLCHLEKGRERLVIDADTHITDLSRMNGELKQRYQASPNYYHGRPLSAEDLLTEMEMARVDMALVWQNPAATPYTKDPRANYEALLAANHYISESARKYPNQLIPGGWTDPKALGIDLAVKLVDTLVTEFGFPFVKMNPAQNQYPIDSEPVRVVTDRIVELGAIPAFHFGADTTYTPADGLGAIAARYPEHPVLAVHMGGGGAGYVEADDLYQRARELGLKHPNLRFVLSAKRDTHIESDLITYQMAGEPFCRNLFCGSDAPYGRMTWNFGGFREMLRSLADGANHTDKRLHANPRLFGPGAAQRYLGGNFADLVIAWYRAPVCQAAK